MMKYQIAWQDRRTGKVVEVIDQRTTDEENFRHWFTELNLKAKMDCQLLLSNETSHYFVKDWKK